MIVNVEVEKTGSENNVSLIKRFTRRVQGSGILPKARAIRYTKRDKSEPAKKNRALKVIERKKEVSKLIKLGKMQDKRNDSNK